MKLFLLFALCRATFQSDECLMHSDDANCPPCMDAMWHAFRSLPPDELDELFLAYLDESCENTDTSPSETQQLRQMASTDHRSLMLSTKQAIFVIVLAVFVQWVAEEKELSRFTAVVIRYRIEYDVAPTQRKLNQHQIHSVRIFPCPPQASLKTFDQLGNVTFAFLRVGATSGQIFL